IASPIRFFTHNLTIIRSFVHHQIFRVSPHYYQILCSSSNFSCITSLLSDPLRTTSSSSNSSRITSPSSDPSRTTSSSSDPLCITSSSSDSSRTTSSSSDSSCTTSSLSDSSRITSHISYYFNGSLIKKIIEFPRQSLLAKPNL